MNRSWKNKPHAGRGLPFRGRGRGWNVKYFGRPPLLDTPTNKYRYINPHQHYYEEHMPHQYEYPPNYGNPSWGYRNRNNFEYQHPNHHHFIPPHPPPPLPLIALNPPPRIVRPPSPLPGSEEYIQREINEKSAYLKRHLALAVPPEHEQNFSEDSDISNFSDNLYKIGITSDKSDIIEIDSENATTQKNEIIRKQHKPIRQQKPHNVFNVNEIHNKILNHISNMSYGQKVNLVNQVTPTSYDVALQQINRQKRLELSKALRDMCNDQLKEDQNSTEIINSIIPDFDIKIEELPKELVEQLSTTLNENFSETVQDCSVDPELFFQQAADMLNISLEVENNSTNEVGSNQINFDNFLETISKDDTTETKFQKVENSTLSNDFEENIFDNPSFLPPNLSNFPVQNDDSNNLNSKSASNEPLEDELYGIERNEESLPTKTEEEPNPSMLSNPFEFDHESESLLNFEETSQYRNPWFNPSPPTGKDETENFLRTVEESPQLSRQESPQTLTDPSWDLPTIEESNVNFEEAGQDQEGNQTMNLANESCRNEEQNQSISDKLNQINILRDDILIENNTMDLNKNNCEEEIENFRSYESSSTEYTERPSSESSKNCSPEKDYKKEQERRLKKMQKRNLRSPNYQEDRRSNKFRSKYSDEKRERRGEERLRGRELEDEKRNFKNHWSHDARHSKSRYYKDELHPHRLEYEDENVYIHNKSKNSYQRSKLNHHHSYEYDEYNRKHKDRKTDYRKPEKQKSTGGKDHIDKKLIPRSTSEERNSKNSAKSLKDRIEMMLKHSTKIARDGFKVEESLVPQNSEGELEQHRQEEKDFIPVNIKREAIEQSNIEEERSYPLNEVAEVDLQIDGENEKKLIEDLELEELNLKEEAKILNSNDYLKNEDNNWKCSKSEENLLGEESQILQENDSLVEENISAACTPPILNIASTEKEEVMEEDQTIEVVPSVSTRKTYIQDHLKQTPPKIWRSPGEKKFMMELYPPKLDHNLVVANDRIESAQLCSRPDYPDQAINNGHLVLLTSRTNPLPFSETNTTDIVAELENCINSMTKTTVTEILNSSEVSSTSDTLKLHENSELKRIAKPFSQNLETCKKNLEKVNETDKNESYRQNKKKKQTTSTQTSVKHKSASVQVVSNVEVQSKISTGIQTNSLLAFENNNEIFEVSHMESGLNKKVLKAKRKKKVVERMREIDKEIERLTKLRQSLYNCITSDNDSENDQPIDSHSKQSEGGSSKKKGGVSQKKSSSNKSHDRVNCMTVVSEKRPASGLSIKSNVSEKKTERRSESSLSHRCASAESHGRGESKGVITERRSESSLSHKSRVSENCERDASVESRDESEKRLKSRSSHKSRTSESRERGASVESRGRGKSKDNVNKRSGSSFSHRSNHESCKRDSSKDKVNGERVAKLYESSVNNKCDPLENSEKGSSIASQKRTSSVVSDKIVKKSRTSSHKNSVLENRERNESSKKTPYVVIKKIVETPESYLCHNRERSKSIERPIKDDKLSSHKYISPENRDPSETRISDLSAEVQIATSENFSNSFCSDSDVGKQKAKKRKIESKSVKKGRSYFCKLRNGKKRGKNSERAKSVKIDRVSALPENFASFPIHETAATVKTSSVSCPETIASASDVLCDTTLKIFSSISPTVNIENTLVTESDEKLVSPKSPRIVPKVILKRFKMKGPRGRKSINQYSETIEAVINEKVEPISEVPPTTASDSCTATVASASDVSSSPSISKTAVITESDTNVISPKLSEIVPRIGRKRLKMKRSKRRKSNNNYSITIEEVVKEQADVPVLDNAEQVSEILPPITVSVPCTTTAISASDVSSVSPVETVSTTVITESDTELNPLKLSEIVPQVALNRLKMKGPKGRKANNHYSEIIDEVAKEIIDVLVLDDAESTSEIMPITPSVSCSATITSESEVSTFQNEEAEVKIGTPELNDFESISDVVLIDSDDGFNDNETKKRPGKRKRVDSNSGPERKRKFKAGKRRYSNRTNSVEIVGKINMFPVVNLSRCEELEIKLKVLPNGGYISSDSEEETVSTPVEPVEVSAVKEEEESIKIKEESIQIEEESSQIEEESIQIEKENTTEWKDTETESIIESCPLVDENYEINFSDFTGAILVIKVIASTAIAASDKGKLFWFNLFTGELLSTHHLSNLPITSIIVVKRNNESIMYVGSLDTSITIMNFEANAIVKKDNVEEPIQCMELAWNCIFIGSDRGSLITYDLNTEKIKEDIKISESNVLMIKATQEGPRKVLVIATRNALVSIRDARTGLLLRTMETPFLPTVYTLLFDKNLIYCGTSQHDILVYTFEDGQLIFKHEATKSKGVVCMQIVGNLLFAGCYNGNIYVYNTKTNVYLGSMSGPGGLMLSMEIVQDKIIVGTKSSNFKAWRIPQKYLDQN